MKDSDWEILSELYKTQNITRAAEHLHMTQPSLTKRLRAIEDEFQVQIVNRTTKGVEFTSQGAFLAEQAEEYIAFSRRLRADLQKFEEPEKKIVIGASYTYSKHVLSGVLARYTQTHPNVRLEVQIESSALLFRMACEGTVDVAFLHGDYEEDSVEQKRISVSNGYVLTQKPVTLDELPTLPRVGYRTNDRTQEIINRWWHDRYGTPVPPEATMAGYVDVAWRCVAQGMGYTCCFLPENNANPFHLCMTQMYFTDGTPVVRNAWFVYRKKKMAPFVEEFIRYIEENAALLEE